MAWLDEIFEQLERRGASDLHIASGSCPKMRLYGQLETVLDRVFAPEECANVLNELVSEEDWDKFINKRDLDFAYETPGGVRVRACFTMTDAGVGAAFRLIPHAVRTADELGLPDVLTRLSMVRRGLVLVTGATGSGKSTTLAAMIDHINTRSSRHVILLEDPIEFVHDDKQSFIVQREVGIHASSYAQAVSAAMREDPDVIMVGELRDRETMEQVLAAVEMGFLVIGTLHTGSAPKAIGRVLDMFEPAQRPSARLTLAAGLRGVVAQQLLRRSDGRGMVAVQEVLINTHAVANMIRAGESGKLHSVMQTGQGAGMQTMDQALMSALLAGQITGDDAYVRAQNRDLFVRYASDTVHLIHQYLS